MVFSSRMLFKIVKLKICSTLVNGNNSDEYFTVPPASARISPADQNLLIAIRSQVETEESGDFLANINVMTEVVKHVKVTADILNYLIEEVHSRIDSEDTERGHKIARFYEEIFLTETNNFALKIRDLTSENLTIMTKYASSYPLLSKIIAHQNSNIETFIAALKNILVDRTNLLCQDLLHALWYKFSDNEDMLNVFALAIEDWNEIFLLFMNKLDPSNEMHMRVLHVLKNNGGINDSASIVDAYIMEYNCGHNLAAAVAGDAPVLSDVSEVVDASVEAADGDASIGIGSDVSEERIINNLVDNLLHNVEIPLRLNGFEEHCRKAARSIVRVRLNIEGDVTVGSEQEAEYIAEFELHQPGVLDAIVDKISLSDPFSALNLAKSNPETINKFRLRVNE